MRTIVDLPERERDQLDALCRQRGLSRAEAIRQAGGAVWQVRRHVAGLAGSTARHASEAGVPEHLIDLRIENNGTLHDLEAAVEAAWATLQDDTIKVSLR